MNKAIQRSVNKRGISRLCHFTPSRNLGHIITDQRGLLATQHLQEEERTIFNPTDIHRLDGHPDHICCSIQYPNAWYFRKAREKELLFPDWVVLLIRPYYLWLPGTKFCPRNAASGGGYAVNEGAEAFETLFATNIEGAYGKIYSREKKAPCIPTDDQAEVLIPDQVCKEDLMAIVVKDKSQVKREIVRLKILDVSLPPLIIAPDFFNAHSLSATLKSGNFPTEVEYESGD